MENQRANENAPQGPAGRVLVLCGVLLAAGYLAAFLRGAAPAREVRVTVVPGPVPAGAAEAPPGP